MRPRRPPRASERAPTSATFHDNRLAVRLQYEWHEYNGQWFRSYHPNAPSWFPAALAVLVDGAIVQCTIFASTDPLAAGPSAVHQLLETIPT
ncbi:MAG: DUF1348 family protein [Ilumatobacteraceae bacterium]